MGKKSSGQYMTPDTIVNMVLDNVGYTGERVLTATIMEPSFGDGNFLIDIVRRIIEYSLTLEKSNSEILDIIKANVFGIEKDTQMYNKGILRLNSLLQDYDIKDFDWSGNLINGDALIEYKRFLNKMDYVVGNPPYVRVHNLKEEYREVVKEFKYANGIIDLYIVFYEIGLMLLNETGKLGYITPNSFLKNQSQRELRNNLIKSKYINSLYDFKSSKIFEEADTYTCILCLDKDINRVDFSIDYKEYEMYNLKFENRLSYDRFKSLFLNKPWHICSVEDMQFLETNKSYSHKMVDIANIQNGIETNNNAIYIIKVFLDNELKVPYLGKHSDTSKSVYFKDMSGKLTEIESGILHRCVKESKYTGVMDNTYIIFPYQFTLNKNMQNEFGKEVENNYVALDEVLLKSLYPKAYAYLESYKDELMKRDMDKNLSWYLFARSQGIKRNCYKKIVFKHIVDKSVSKMESYILDEDVIIYSGMFTTVNTDLVVSFDKESNMFIFNTKLYDEILNDIKQYYESLNFARYCILTGKDMSGGYSEISTKTVKAFGLDFVDTPFYFQKIDEKA
jgi:adenine-specific DNA-methyltransferase